MKTKLPPEAYEALEALQEQGAVVSANFENTGLLIEKKCLADVQNRMAQEAISIFCRRKS